MGEKIEIKKEDNKEKSLEQKKTCHYMRVSTKEQSTKHSLDAQREALIKYDKENNLVCVKEYVDTTSGLNMDREELLNLLDDSKKNIFDIVTVTERDRLSRNPDHMAILRWELKKKNIDIVATEQNMDGKSDFEVFIDKILSLLSWWEVKQFQIRAKRGRVKAEKKGIRCNRPPLIEKYPDKYYHIIGLKDFLSLRAIGVIVNMSPSSVKYVIDNQM